MRDVASSHSPGPHGTYTTPKPPPGSLTGTSLRAWPGLASHGAGGPISVVEALVGMGAPKPPFMGRPWFRWGREGGIVYRRFYPRKHGRQQQGKVPGVRA